jgi:hypothetical protein
MSGGTEGRLRRLEGQLLPRNRRGRVVIRAYWGGSPEAAQTKGGRVIRAIWNSRDRQA